MICPGCKTEGECPSISVETVANGRRRVRVCKRCRTRFTTLETMRGLRRVREVVETGDCA